LYLDLPLNLPLNLPLEHSRLGRFLTNLSFVSLNLAGELDLILEILRIDGLILLGIFCERMFCFFEFNVGHVAKVGVRHFGRD